ncbi:hypothetical protein [uncultured Sulfitobacter sp.]|uniref:hypothetical protein n=1 Tax=uncultured Sulfitobacter sp. TaxID=191468 RepID=UPI00262F303E|nr:hypothetical protein [uncultured Sulfitobacter sp.]
MTVMLSVVFLMGAQLVPAPATAQGSAQPKHGLMWNKTGLPAVFPLQVKTNSGKNYVLLLSDIETGADVLAAFITGGTFFRVLVPPGTYRVRFASGVSWRDDGTMFGAFGKTRIIEMPEPMTFKVLGLSRKAGHLIDLTETDLGRLTQVDLSICQTVSWLEEMGPIYHYPRSSEFQTEHARLAFRLRSRYCFL